MKLYYHCALFISFMLAGTSTICAQNTLSPEQKVTEFLGAEQYNYAVANNPGLIEYLKYKVEKGYFIENAVESKTPSYTMIDSVYYNKKPISISLFVKATEKNDFNFLFYTFLFNNQSNSGTILLGDSGKIMIIYSNRHINQAIKTQ